MLNEVSETPRFHKVLGRPYLFDTEALPIWYVFELVVLKLRSVPSAPPPRLDGG